MEKQKSRREFGIFSHVSDVGIGNMIECGHTGTQDGKTSQDTRQLALFLGLKRRRKGLVSAVCCMHLIFLLWPGNEATRQLTLVSGGRHNTQSIERVVG